MVSRLKRIRQQRQQTAAAERELALAFERRVRLNRFALLGERIWEALLWPAMVLAAFLVISLFQLWSFLPPLLHRVLLGCFAVALVAALWPLLRIALPTRDEAIRRLERNAGIKHRPATSYEDSLATGGLETSALWAAHRRRLAGLIKRLKPSWPEPRNDRRDPYALRAGLLILLFVALIVAGPDASDRLKAAFNPAAAQGPALLRLDAWVTPPVYTGVAPIVLADGSETIGEGNEAFRALSVPVRSELVVRAHAPEGDAVHLDIGDGAAAKTVEPKPAQDGLVEFSLPLTKPGPAHVVIGGSTVATWRFSLIGDEAPKISLDGKPTTTPRDALRLAFHASDDYGVASAEADFALAPDASDHDAAASDDSDTALVEPAVAPLFKPPVINLPLDRANADHVAGRTTEDLTSHPWAGLKVLMTLVAKDQAGQRGKSPVYEFILPERNFTKPLAKAVVEQRRKLVRNPAAGDEVADAIDALTLGGPAVIADPRVYLGLRSAYWRLQDDQSRPAIRSVVDQLWEIALRIEDGDLPDAERALKTAQERLEQALKNGASPQQIKQLVDNLRSALAKYLQSLAQQAQAKGAPPPNMPPNGQQSVSPQSLEKMLENIEKLAQAGSTDMAQKMLSQMKDMLERLQASNGAPNPKQQQMQRAMQDLDKLINQQQKLLDQTFNANRKQGQGQSQQNAFEVSPPGQPMPWGQQGMNFPGLYGEPQEGQPGQDQQGQGEQGQGQQGQGQQGQQGQGEQGQQGQAGQRGASGGRGGSSPNSQLAQRQNALMQKLQSLIDSMRIGAGGAPDQLSDAGQSMGDAKKSIGQNDLDNAAQQQGMALDSMRQGAKSMAQQMQSAQGQQGGGQGENGQDPLGRPDRRSQPDFGLSVKVPDRIDIQRARQVLDELRRRLGDPNRPMIELDYLDRLIHSY